MVSLDYSYRTGGPRPERSSLFTELIRLEKSISLSLYRGKIPVQEIYSAGWASLPIWKSQMEQPFVIETVSLLRLY